jgi:hypothetical protein
LKTLIAAVLACSVIIAAPTAISALLTDPGSVLAAGLSGLVWTLFFLGLSKVVPSRPLAIVIIVGSILLVFMIRMMHLGVVQFSGTGFSANFFFHLGSDAIRVAAREFSGLFMVTASGAVVLIITSLFAVFRFWNAAHIKFSAALMTVAALTLVGLRFQLPEYQLAEGWARWKAPVLQPLNQSDMQRWRQAEFITIDLVSKDELRATQSRTPLNLIIVYLESVGLSLLQSEQWPALMPNLSELHEQHGLSEAFNASGFITIEGFVNSQCGTLFPFERGSDSLAGSDGLAERMACLGDVLASAGYRQSYLGGAELSFAGKGKFLNEHGFDATLGINHWRSVGLTERKGTWGLSDADLFKQSLNEIQKLRNIGEPYNLTLLTIGTHLPGYRYEECAPYQHSDAKFLQALHCTDQLVAQWLDALRLRGVMDDTLVLLTADHQAFPNHDMKSLFGEDAISDKRLPFIAMGAGVPKNFSSVGAQYDLAPTVLDMLDISHNAQFSLGRSLLRGKKRSFFINRFSQVIDGKTLPASVPGCSNDIPAAPLDHCERQQLSSLLQAQIDGMSANKVEFACHHKDILGVSFPQNREQPLSIVIDGKEQIDRFTWNSRPIAQSSPGLFLIHIDEQKSHVISRNFVPAEKITNEAKRTLPSLSKNERVVAIWRATDLEDAKPSWLGEGGSSQALALLAPSKASKETTVELIPLEEDPAGVSWNMPSARCASFLE